MTDTRDLDWVFDLPEAEAAGLAPEAFDLLAVDLPPAALPHLVFDPSAARAFLLDEIALAKGQASHWQDMLAGHPPPADHPPVFLAEGDGWEVLDGLHRLAGLCATGADETVRTVWVVPAGEPIPDRALDLGARPASTQ